MVLSLLGGLRPAGRGRGTAGARGGGRRAAARRVAARHRADAGRVRDLDAGARHLGPGGAEGRAGDRLRQHRRLEHRQHPADPWGGGADHADRRAVLGAEARRRVMLGVASPSRRRRRWCRWGGVGVAFVAGLVAYIWMAFRQERAASAPDHGAVYEKSAAAQAADPALDPAPPRGGSLALSLAVLVAIGAARGGGGRATFSSPGRWRWRGASGFPRR
jgi:hypothetical protein